MREIKWNTLKSERLKKVRGVSFEEILAAKLVDVIRHSSRQDQIVLVYEHKGYLWAVPSVMDQGVIFLKTLYPSRQLMKIYGRRHRHEKRETD